MGLQYDMYGNLVRFGEDDDLPDVSKKIDLDEVMQSWDVSRAMGTPPYELDLVMGWDKLSLGQIKDAYVVANMMVAEWEATGAICDGCIEIAPNNQLFLYYDVLGIGFFDSPCMKLLLNGVPTPAMVSKNETLPAFFVERNNPLLGLSIAKIIDEVGQQLTNYNMVDAPKGTTSFTKPKVSNATSWSKSPQCRLDYNFGHLSPLPLGSNGGGVIASASRVGQIHDDATAALFFDNAWKSAKFFKVETKNNDKLVIPDFSAASAVIPTAFIPWTDMKAPHRRINDYVEWAVKYIAEGNWLQVGCIGAHGRTGTFIALMLLHSELAATAFDAIKQTRELYCDKAVESLDQIKYIYEYAGEEPPTSAVPTDKIQPWKDKEDAEKAVKSAPQQALKKGKTDNRPPVYKLDKTKVKK
jgi:protein-tyrosine phosphatase